MHRILLAVIACAIAVPAVAAPGDDLMTVERTFSDTVGSKGLPTAYLSYLAEDAVDFGTGGMAPLYGRAAYEASVRAGKADNPKGSVLSWSPEHVKMSADGTMGAVDGTWTFLGVPPTDGSARLRLSGHYLRVWKKDASGAWKIEDDMATNDPAPKP
jgi:ketosteroid isomerase-like protein